MSQQQPPGAPFAGAPHQSPAGAWPPGHPSQGYPPQGYPQGWHPQMNDPAYRQKMAEAQRLVTISQILGWGGILMLLVGTIAVGVVTRSGIAAGITAGLAVISTVVGAVVGQIGRGMQGRVI